MTQEAERHGEKSGERPGILLWPIVYRLTITGLAGYSVVPAILRDWRHVSFMDGVVSLYFLFPSLVVIAALLFRRSWACWLSIGLDATWAAHWLGVSAGYIIAAGFASLGGWCAGLLLLSALGILEGIYLLRKLSAGRRGIWIYLPVATLVAGLSLAFGLALAAD